MERSTARVNSQNIKNNKENRFIAITISHNIAFFIGYFPDGITQLWARYRFRDGVSIDMYYQMIGTTFVTITGYWRMIFIVIETFIFFIINSVYRKTINDKIICCKCLKKNKNDR